MKVEMWSEHNPLLQRIWDATSFRALMACPRRYQLSIQQGWRRRERDPHLTLGSLLQEGIERYHLARLKGARVEEAGVQAISYLLEASGEFQAKWDGGNPGWYEWEPWGGEWVQKWRCTGAKPWKNAKGRKAKCPFSHHTSAGPKWFEAEPHHEAFTDCQECGSPIEIAWHYNPDHPTKNRLTLMRAMVAFIDSQDEEKGLQVWALPDGTPAVELQITVPLGRKTPGASCEVCNGRGLVEGKAVSVVPCGHCGGDGREEGEDHLLVANLDEINTWLDHLWPGDNKSTSRALNDAFFEQFAPDIQFDLYDLVTSIAPYPIPIGGVVVRGIRVGKGDAEVRAEYITKTEGQREEFWRELHWWVEQAERFAESGYYPMNRASCKGCAFRKICDMDPSMRSRHLARDFERRPWHPITRGGPQVSNDDGV